MRSLFAFLSVAIILIGCKKDLPEDPILPDEPGPVPAGLTLISGDTTGMVVFYHSDTVRSQAFSWETLSIDLDGSQGYELSIHTNFIFPSQTTTPAFYTWIENVHPDLRFIGFYKTDTIEQMADTTLIYDGADNYPWQLNIYKIVGCDHQGENAIFRIDQNIFRPHIYEEGSSMDTLAVLPVDSILLRQWDQTYSMLGLLNDSTRIYWNTEYFHSSCFNIPEQDIFYIGFVLGPQGTPRKGFLCLELIYGGIVIHYAAIEP